MKIRSGIIDRIGDPHATQEYFKGLQMLLDAARLVKDIARPAP